MAKFTDCLEREWDLTLTLGAVSRVRKSHKIDLGKILSDHKELVRLLYEDFDMLGQVLYGLLEKQIKAANLTDDDFIDGFDGPAIQRARDAFAEAIANFSLPPQVATAAVANLKKAMGATDELKAALIDQETDRAISTLKNTDTNLPASAA